MRQDEQFALGLLFTAAAALGFPWLIGAAASVLAGHGFSGPGLAAIMDDPAIVLREDLPLWSRVAAGVLAVMISACALLLFVLTRSKGSYHHKDNHGLRELARSSRRKEWDIPKREAARLRGDIDSPRDLSDAARGLTIGRVGRAPVRMTWEDGAVLIAPPRTGKTTSIAIPAVLSAPGACVCTSNKPDVADIAAVIAHQGRRVWIFDPQAIFRADTGFRWDPLSAVTSRADAKRLANSFVSRQESAKSNNPFWPDAARDVLSLLFLAAAVSEDESISSVSTWLETNVRPAIVLLNQHGYTNDALALETIVTSAEVTWGGIRAHAQVATACLRSDGVMRVTSPTELTQFDPAAFLRSNDTLILLSQELDGESAAPLVAALVSDLLRLGIRAGDPTRLSPPMTLVLDEAANICPIAELPDLYSHAGSRGIVILTILQSLAQGKSTWGDVGMAKLFDAATVRLIAGGLNDAKLAQDLSTLLGAVMERKRTSSRTSGAVTRGESYDERPILSAGQIAQLPKYKALALGAGRPPLLLQLDPWTRQPDATEIAAAIAASEALRSQELLS